MAYLSDDELLDTEGDFTGWDDETGTGATGETLNRRLRKNVLAELESELEQDEHPIDYEAGAGGRGRRSRPGQRKAAETGFAEAIRVLEGSRPHRKARFPGRWRNGTSWD